MVATPAAAILASAKPLGARTEIHGNVVRVYDSNNVLRVQLGVW